MNFSFHFFGNPGKYFKQYPNDQTAGDNLKFINTSGRVLLIERKGSLMTYVYCRWFESSCCAGFRIALNSNQISRPKALINLLSGLTDNMLAQGSILRCNSAGDVEYAVSDLNDVCHEIESLRQYLDFQFTTYPYQFGLEAIKGFPESEEEHRVSIDATDAEIEASTYNFGRVLVYSDQPFKPGIYPKLIKSLHADIAKQQQVLAQKAVEIHTLQRQKKQFKVVIGLMVLLLGAGLWLYSLKGNLDITRSELSSANEKISADSLRIVNLSDSLNVATGELAQKRVQISRVKQAASKLHSEFFLPGWTSTNHRHNSISDKTYYFYAYPGDELSFDYYVDSEGADKFYFRVEGPSTYVSDYYSGLSQRGSRTISFTDQGHYTFYVSYKKDGTVHNGSDYVRVYSIKLTRAGVSDVLKAL